jgi:threonine synthase
VRYLSTRGAAPAASLDEAILAGLAPDGGLYVPEHLPRLDADDLAAVESLREVAVATLAPFFAGSTLAPALAELAAAAYAFDAPLVATGEAGCWVLELFHGPTAAFKDFGARFLAACLGESGHGRDTGIGDSGRGPGRCHVTVLVATSGDTGSAVAAAFHRRPGVRVVILYPDGKVSPRQAHQLGCFGDNVTALRVAGSFDDCQRLVKQAFADRELRAAVPLASANSISLGRLLPQMAYYAHAALEHRRRSGRPLSFVIPTGNLGNAFACLLARAVGAPIGAVELATNANRTLPEFIASGVYRARPSVATLANAMDVGDPSNVERLRWLYAEHGALVRAVLAESVDDATIAARIAEGEHRYGRVWCPHTACAVEVLERLRRAGEAGDWCVVATAHPAKFESVVEPLVGHSLELPPALAAMLCRPARAEPLAADYAALRERLSAA